MDQNGLNWTKVNEIGPKRTELDQSEQNWTKMDQIGPNGLHSR